MSESLATTAAELSSAGKAGGGVRTVVYTVGLLATLAVVIVASRAAKRALNAELKKAA